jgi:hypothetical protein
MVPDLTGLPGLQLRAILRLCRRNFVCRDAASAAFCAALSAGVRRAMAATAALALRFSPPFTVAGRRRPWRKATGASYEDA